MKTFLLRSWINPKLVAGASKIHGDGVIAAAAIRQGEKLMEFGGLAISAADVASEIYRARSVWVVAEGRYLGLPESDPHPSLDENLNHSCDANAWLDDEVVLSARRDIAAGEEITLDQGTWNFEEDDYVWDQDRCTCGAADCRRVLTETDWKLPAVQVRYRGHFHPMVQRMIDAAQRTPRKRRVEAKSSGRVPAA